MGFRYTQATRNIINFTEEYGFITVNICANIFYKGNSNPMHQARTKLNTLYNNKVLARYKNQIGEYIYQVYKKTIGDHNYFVTKLYSYLFKEFDVLYFKTEKTWLGGKRRSDAHIIIDNGSKRLGLLVEFENFHATKREKLDEIYNSGEVQRWYKGEYGVDYYPITLMITPSGSSKLCDIEEYIVLATNYRFDGLIEDLKGI